MKITAELNIKSEQELKTFLKQNAKRLLFIAQIDKVNGYAFTGRHK